MITSMTGFGKAEAQLEDKRIDIEIRSLNSKTADINIRIPTYVREMDSKIRKLLFQRLKRGKIDLVINVVFTGNQTPTIINAKVVKRYIEQLKSISPKSENQCLSIAMRLPDALTVENKILQEDEKAVVNDLLNQALHMLSLHRQSEGKELAKDFVYRLEQIEKLLMEVNKIDSERIENTSFKLRSEIDKLKAQVDENRFEQELIYYLEKFDITEEKVRLKNHVSYFREVMNGESNGKKLGFITQEMGREINTIGAKANHVGLQKIVIQMKDELEKIKEQVFNVL